MTTVSVVMPVRNEAGSVAGAITSVLAQSFEDVELLVVDGDSTDGTVEQVRRIADSEPRVRLLSNPERTIPQALNIGLREARGRYLARVDAHASVNDTYLERGVRTLDGDPAVAAVGGRRIGVARSRSGVAVATALSSRFGVGDSINHYAEVPQDTDHASFGVFRVDVLRAVGGWDEQLLVNEDVDIDHRILAAGHRIRFDPDMCIYWHVRETLPALARQYRRYGRGKAAMVRKNGRQAVRVRHLAPPALVVALTGAATAGVAGLWFPALGVLGGVLAAPYAVALTGATVATLRTATPVHRPCEVAQVERTRLAGLAAAEPAPPRPAQPADHPNGPVRGVGATLAGFAAGEERPRSGSGTTRSAGARTGEPQPSPTAEGTLSDRRPGALRLAGAFVAMHLGWGLGFLEGTLLKLRPAASSARLPRTPGGGAAEDGRRAGPHEPAKPHVTGVDSGRTSSGV